jgi:hypothetical protein
MADSLLKAPQHIDGITAMTFDDRFLQTPIAREYITYYRSRDPILYRYILSFLRCLKKAEFKDSTFEKTALRGWIETEELLAARELPTHHLANLREIVAALIPNQPEAGPFMGKHGSGAVASAERGNMEKSLNFEIDPYLRSVISQYSMLNKFDDSEIKILLDLCGAKSVPREGIRSVLTFVAKNYKTVRSICMEPIAHMFFQQDVMYRLVSAVNAGLAGLFINFKDQTRNQDGALYGSLTGDLDTLDSSKASDTIRADLVRSIFPRKWLPYLMGTRTNEVELPNGEVYKVCKFAPMGSALCFPVQSIVFLSIVVYAYILHYRGKTPHDVYELDVDVTEFIKRSISKKWMISSDYSSIGVYGDDIICDSRCTDNVMDLLLDLGFLPNAEKSFTGQDAFRESCGMFALDGMDVTPYHHKCKHFDTEELSGEHYARLIDGANRLGDLQYTECRSNLVNFILKFEALAGCDLFPIRFSDREDDAFTIYSTNPRNDHLQKRKWSDYSEEEREEKNIDPYQCGEVRCFKLVSKDVDVRRAWQTHMLVWDAYELHSWSRSSALRGETFQFGSARKLQRGTKLKWVWTPT